MPSASTEIVTPFAEAIESKLCYTAINSKRLHWNKDKALLSVQTLFDSHLLFGGVLVLGAQAQLFAKLFDPAAEVLECDVVEEPSIGDVELRICCPQRVDGWFYVAAARSGKWNDGLSLEVCSFNEAVNDVRCYAPPDGESYEDDVVVAEVSRFAL